MFHSVSKFPSHYNQGALPAKILLSLSQPCDDLLRPGVGSDPGSGAAGLHCSRHNTREKSGAGEGRGGEGGEVPLPPSSHTDTDIICNALFSVRTGGKMVKLR